METLNKNIVLRTEDLTIGYSTRKTKHVVAAKINITLKKGELIGLVGSNGIGKSTLIRTLIKVQQPLKGQIFINDKSILDFNSNDLAKALSIVLTEPVAAKNLSVMELIALGRQPYTNWVGNLSDADMAIVNHALQQTNIDSLKHKKCYELSDGQLQKVMITRALAQNTDLIILDEPTTHLDMYHKAYVLKLLQKLARETNKTILFSSHEIDLAIQLCDKLIVMTNNSVTIDTPENHIKKGNFNALFPKDLIVFDESNGSFRVKR